MACHEPCETDDANIPTKTARVASTVIQAGKWHALNSTHTTSRRAPLRDTSQDKAWTKEEQLLGYTSEQRQRMKALHTLGLTEAAFDKCRAIMLSSLGPSAFGVDADETAASAARAAKEEEWTPNGNPRNVHQNAGGVQNLLRKKSLQHQG